MYGFGEPSGQTPDTTLGPASNLNVGVDYFAWGFGDPDPHTASAPAFPTWAGESDWGFGDPETLISDHILWTDPKVLPDDGGTIVTLTSTWPSIGPYTIKCVLTHTGQQFPEATAPLPFCKSPAPGFAERCYTDILRQKTWWGGVVPAPGNKLRFVLPVLPPGRYSVEITPPNGPKIVLSNIMEIVWRNRSTQEYSIRNRWPEFFETGQRSARYEPMLGYDPESEEELT